MCLHQVEITLETMAYWQCVLTFSLVDMAGVSYQIHKAYKYVIESNDVNSSIVLLTDYRNPIGKDLFDIHYTPADVTGKAKYFQEDGALGHGNRYLGVHQYFMFASLLDPHVLPILSHIMTQVDFLLLKVDIIDLMVALPDAKPHCFQQKDKQSSQMIAKMFSGLSTQGTLDNISDDDDTIIHHTYQMELECYLRDARSGACPMNNSESEFNNALIWWTVNAVKYPYVANLSHKKYHAIPMPLLHLLREIGVMLQEFYLFVVLVLRMILLDV